MIDLLLGSGRVKSILCIGAHCDDIEIGCGGTLLQLQKAGTVRINCAILTGSQERQSEATRAFKLLVKPANRGTLLFAGFADARLPAAYEALKDVFETLRTRFNPDIVFCHARSDAHQDHRVANELAWGAFRNHLILEYEIPKWDGDLGTPNVYVPLTRALAQRKVDLLMRAYGSQRNKDWFTPDTFLSLMHLRGMECRSAGGFAEAFMGRKLSLSFRPG